MEGKDNNPLIWKRQRELYELMLRHMNLPKQAGGKKKKRKVKRKQAGGKKKKKAVK